MPRKPKKPHWNAGGIPGLGLEAPRHAPPPPLPRVPVTPSTGLVFSPRADDESPQPPPAPAEEKKPAATD